MGKREMIPIALLSFGCLGSSVGVTPIEATRAESGQTIKGEKATRDMWVCGAGAYIVLKALAFKLRGENKDAYDLFYVLRNYGESVSAIVAHLEPSREDPATRQAIEVLRRDFTSLDGLGPMRVAAFVAGGSDDPIQADVAGFVESFLRRYET